MRLQAIVEQSTTIISGHKRSNTPEQNRRGIGALIKDMRAMGLSFKLRSGRWEGTKEISLLIKGLTCDQAVALMKKHGQDAIMFNGRVLKSCDH